MDFFENLRDYLQKNKAHLVIEQLINYLKGNKGLKHEYRVLSTISTSYHLLIEQQLLGLLTKEEIRVETQSLVNRLFQLIDNIKQETESLDLYVPLTGPALKKELAIPSFTSEKIIGIKNTIKNICWLEEGLNKSRGICRIINGSPLNRVKGTGFLIEGGLLITNHHVLRSLEEASHNHTTAQFNFVEDINGTFRQTFDYRLDPSSFATYPEKDISVAKLIPDPVLPSIAEWGTLEVAKTKINVGDHVTIIHHPNGGPKQISLNENQVVNLFSHHVQYTTDTLPGSSGAPVFDDQWKVIAIHHAGGELKVNELDDTRYINQGILLDKLRSDLADY